jgi:hypothetical protein
MRPFTQLGILFACCAAASAAGAQHDERAKVQTVVGCWTVEPGPLSVVGRSGVDPGQTTLPSLIQFDTVPGKSWTGEPLGRRVRALTGDNGTRYRDGYYLFSDVDSLRVEWTNSVVGMSLLLRVESLVMHGRASAWTDYMGTEEASLVMRRTACPSPFSNGTAPSDNAQTHQGLRVEHRFLAQHADAQAADQSPLPPPTGQHSVGRAQFDWIDESRADSTTPSRHREVVV